MHAQKRSAARSKRAARSTLSSSDPIRGCLGDLPAIAILPVAISSSLKINGVCKVFVLPIFPARRQTNVLNKVFWVTVRVLGFGCWASVHLSLLSDRNSCSNSAELCTTVGRSEDETDVVISKPDQFHKLRPYTTQRQTTINSITVQK